MIGFGRVSQPKLLIQPRLAVLLGSPMISGLRSLAHHDDSLSSSGRANDGRHDHETRSQHDPDRTRHIRGAGHKQKDRPMGGLSVQSDRCLYQGWN